jgi:hypothetical protein
MRGNEVKEVEPETIAVMFVEHTKNGELAKRLQKAEDEMAKTAGFRIRVTEMDIGQLAAEEGATKHQSLTWQGLWQGEVCAMQPGHRKAGGLQKTKYIV